MNPACLFPVGHRALDIARSKRFLGPPAGSQHPLTLDVTHGTRILTELPEAALRRHPLNFHFLHGKDLSTNLPICVLSGVIKAREGISPTAKVAFQFAFGTPGPRHFQPSAAVFAGPRAGAGKRNARSTVFPSKVILVQRCEFWVPNWSGTKLE